MVQGRLFRRNSLRWSPAEIDRLVRAVKLEDVNPPVELFHAVAANLERNPQSARSMWLEVRDAGLRGRQSSSPAVAAYVRRRFPRTEDEEVDEFSLDALVSAYSQAQRRADSLRDRIFSLAAADSEALAGMRLTLFGKVQSLPQSDDNAAITEGELEINSTAAEIECLEMHLPAA